MPGLKTNKDSMPNIRKIKAGTTSGLMLSSGYGGGTANLEYMGLSGLSMANFDSSLSSPYQQLVPSQHWTPTINQMWVRPPTRSATIRTSPACTRALRTTRNSGSRTSTR